MTTLVEIGLSNALLATILAVVVAIVARVVRRPAVVHALWVLVLLKLVTPPMLHVPVGFEIAFDTPATAPVAAPEPVIDPNDDPASAESTTGTPSNFAVTRRETRPRVVESSEPNGTGKRPVAVEARHRTSGLAASPRSAVRSRVEGAPRARRVGGRDRRRAVATVPVVAEQAASASPETGWSLPPLTPLFVISSLWLSGLVLVLGAQFLAVCRCSKWLDRGGRATECLQREANAVAAELGLERCPRVWIVSTALPPMLYALGPFARVVLPSPLLREVDDGTRRLLLAHELAHYQRGDHWVRLLELLAVSLFWWHPVVWWARREIHETEETCCDALVVERVSRRPRVYAEALLDTIDFLSRSAATAPLASGLGSRESIRRRLTAIMQRNVSASVGPRAWWGVVVFAAIVLPLAPVAFDAPPAEARAAIASRGGERGSGIPRPSTDERLVRPGERNARSSRPSFAALLDRSPLAPQPVVWAVATSPDGRVTITADTDMAVRYRNANTSREVDLSSEGITAVAFPADSATFVTSHGDGRLRLWDSSTATPLATVLGHEDAVRTLVASPDGRLLISGSADGTLRAWRIARDAEVWSLDEMGSTIDTGRPVNCVRFDPIGGGLLVGLGDWRTPDSGRVVILPADVFAAAPAANVVADAPSVDFDTAVGAIWFDGTSDRTFVGEWNGTATSIDPRTLERLELGRAPKDGIAASSYSSAAPVPSFAPRPVVAEPTVTVPTTDWVRLDGFTPLEAAPRVFPGTSSTID